MPQLNTSTYLPQIFWFLVFFLTFYFITVKYFLPKISKILKIRKKLTLLMNGIVFKNKNEMNTIEEITNNSLITSIIKSKNYLTAINSQTNKWINLSIKDINDNITLMKTHIKIIENIGIINSKKHLFNQLQNNLIDKNNFPIIEENNIKKKKGKIKITEKTTTQTKAKNTTIADKKKTAKTVKKSTKKKK